MLGHHSAALRVMANNLAELVIFADHRFQANPGCDLPLRFGIKPRLLARE